MSAIPCSVCKQKRPGKLAAAYWAWFDAQGNRRAYKLRYCHLCAPDALRPVIQALRNPPESDAVFACHGCGGDASQDSDPLYLTLYIPNRDVEELHLQFDSACAAKYRIGLVNSGEPLEDRGGGVRGPSPTMTVWDTLGSG